VLADKSKTFVKMTDIALISQLLGALTQPNTETIRVAELALKPMLKDPRSVASLLTVLKTTEQPSIRHVAAVVLRKRVASHFKMFDAGTKMYVKNEILDILRTEPERTVRHGVAAVAAELATIEIGSPQQLYSAGGGGNWPELFQFISVAANPSNPNADARELGFFLLSEMTESIAENMKDQLPGMAQLYASALTLDTPDKVQQTALRALGSIIAYISEPDEGSSDIVGTHYAPLIPSLLAVANQCRNRGDEETVNMALDVLYDLAYSPSGGVAPHIPLIVQFALSCLVDENLDNGVRDSAALVIATLAEAKPKTLGKSGCIDAIVETLFNLIENSDESAAGALFESNPAWNEDDDDENEEDVDLDDSPTATSMAQGTLDMLACELPKKYIFGPVVSRCVARLSSPHANHRKAGIACLGVIAEGCAEPLREYLPDVMAHVFSAAADSDAQVRECACFCLGQLSEHCQPEILLYSSQILPIVFALLDDTNAQVQTTSCYVLEMFCERLEPAGVRPLLDPLVRKLAAMLEGATKRSVQEMAVAALAATAVAAEDEFIPYISGVANLMLKLMTLREEKMYTLRGRALECMGHIAIAVGKEPFRPYFTATMQCACEGLQWESTDLHEFAYAVFANLSKVMGPDFSPILGELVPHLVKVIATDEGQLETTEEEKESQFNLLDDSDEEDEASNYVFNVRTALFESKKGAITAIGEMASYCGASYVPYIEVSMQVLQNACKNWHPMIRCQAAEALPCMVIPTIAANHDGEISWEKGDISGPSPMSVQTSAVAEAVLTELLSLMDDDSKDTVGKACEGVQRVIELCGPHALLPIANECLQKTFDLLSRKGRCQESEDGYEEDAPDDEQDHDSFMTSVCDLVGSFCRVMGDHFVQYIPQYLRVICTYIKSSRPPSDRSMAMGCLGEIAQEMGSAIADQWQPVFLPAILAGFVDEDDNVKRNSAFAAGMCCEGLGGQITSYYPQILQAISPLFLVDTTKSDYSAACVDNAAAAVSRMILTSPEHVPISQVLPFVLRSLPLKSDFTENETVYRCLLTLLEIDHPDAVSSKTDIRRIFQDACAEDSKVDEDLKRELASALSLL